jgi:hypothetical protein
MAVELPEDRAVHPLRERMDAIAQPRMASELGGGVVDRVTDVTHGDTMPATSMATLRSASAGMTRPVALRRLVTFALATDAERLHGPTIASGCSL